MQNEVRIEFVAIPGATTKRWCVWTDGRPFCELDAADAEHLAQVARDEGYSVSWRLS
jgi:hypothetical protein